MGVEHLVLRTIRTGTIQYAVEGMDIYEYCASMNVAGTVGVILKVQCSGRRAKRLGKELYGNDVETDHMAGKSFVGTASGYCPNSSSVPNNERSK